MGRYAKTPNTYRTKIVFVCLGVFVFLALIAGRTDSTQQVVSDMFETKYAYAHESSTFTLSSFLLQSIIDELSILRRENSILQREINDLRDRKRNTRGKTRVLIVAGHTAQTKGAVFGSLSEYDLNYELMHMVGDLLENDRDFEVTLSHDGDDYSQEFLDYFDENEEEILEYRKQLRETYSHEYPQGITTNDTDHNHASPRATIELYGVNKWVSENDIDMVVHLHFNDYPGRVSGAAGEHTGFSVFVPLKTNDHFVESFRLGKLLEQEMLKHTQRSTVKRESAGVMESELIAVGQANSVSVPAVLLEGGYIYEEQFINPKTRTRVLERIAESVHRALERY